MRCMFVFGMGAMKNLVKIAESITSEKWYNLEKELKYEVRSQARNSKYLAEFFYRPGK